MLYFFVVNEDNECKSVIKGYGNTRAKWLDKTVGKHIDMAITQTCCRKCIGGPAKGGPVND